MKSALALTLVALLATGCVNRAAQEQAKKTQEILEDPTRPVVVATVSTKTLSESLRVTGEVTTSQDAVVGAKVAGRIVSVYVKDGDSVSAGQVIAVQETSTQAISLQQAQSQVAAAQAALNQARQNALLGPQRSRAALETAKAQLRSAQAQLQKARTGARPEERRQAEAAVAAAKSNMETAKSQASRARDLYAAGAISKSQLEVAENAYQAAISQYENAVEQLNMARNWTRPEDISVAEEGVRQAQEAVRSAEAQKKLDSLLIEQVDAARANLRAAQSQAMLVQQQISDAQIRAPFNGRISGNPIQPGTVAAPGTPVVRIIGSGGIYFEGEIPESALGSVRPGGLVTISVDAVSDRTYAGTVMAISPVSANVGRLFKARIQFASTPSEVKPGMFARGDVVVKSIPDATTVPVTAIVRRSGKDVVYVVSGSTVTETPVTRGLQANGDVQVSGVKPGDQVVIQGQADLADKSKISIEKPKADN